MRSQPKPKPRYEFCVYIGGHTRKTGLAIARLRKMFDETIPGDYEIKIIDLAKHPELAGKYNIVATPAVFRTLPDPVRKSIGDLSVADKALLGLDLVVAKSVARVA